MATEPRRVVLTYDDYVQIPADRLRYEILEGELSVSAAPNVAHQICLGNLFVALSAHARAARLGLVLPAPTDVVLSNITVVQPDLLFVAAARQAIVTPQNIRGAPDLVVEILSPSTSPLDRGLKMQLYARHSVASYWLVDPAERTIEAYRLDGGDYRLLALGRGDDTFGAPPFPDLGLPLAELWD